MGTDSQKHKEKHLRVIDYFYELWLLIRIDFKIH